MYLKSFIQWNLQSYKTKFTNLKCILNKYHPICVALQETLHKDRELKPPAQYKVITSNVTRNDNHERGTAILIQGSYNYETLQLNTQLQACAVKIYLDKVYTICSLYLPHVPVSKQEINHLIAQLPKPFMIMGDMNARSSIWNNTDRNEKGKIFEDILLETEVVLLNDGTRTHYHSQTNTTSAIDLTLCSPDCQLDFTYSVLEELYDSDHYPVHIELVNNNILPMRLERFNTKKADWERYEKLTAINTVDIQEVERATEMIVGTVQGAAELSIPKVKGKLRRPPMPWWNEECDRAKKERTRAERAMKTNPNEYNKLRYSRAKAICRYIFNRSKKESWRKYVGKINCRTKINEVWNRVKKLRGKQTGNTIPVIYDNNGNVEVQPLQVANIMAECFSTGGHSNQTAAFIRYKRQEEEKQLELEGGEELEYNKKITSTEFIAILKTTKDSSPGPDGITYNMIKRAHPSLQQLIINLYNRILMQREFPSEWKTAIIIPIPKENGEDFKDPRNYRPISLTNCLCKILEKIINVRLMWYLESKNIISPYQSGFRQNRSSTDHIVHLENVIRQEIARKNHTIAVFFDIQKAYDTAWRHYIIKKLQQAGLRGHLIYFIKNFLSNRKIKVQISNVFSNPIELREGIPQGSVLSCTCFLISINEITNNMSHMVYKTIYVDDFAIYSSGKNERTVKRQIQIALNKVAKWCEDTGFTFSLSKTDNALLQKQRM